MGGQDANALFAEYGQSHQHPVNKAIHCVCVPLIFFCTVRLLAALPLNGVYAATTAALIWYVWLDLRIALGMFVVSAACIYGSAFVTVPQAIGIFALAWVGQFIGHSSLFEGKKPSFFKDVFFLLVGPAWLLHFVYKMLGVWPATPAAKKA